MKNTNTEITVYTYGMKHTFPNMRKAKAEVKGWMAGSEGAERDRYVQVYLMLEEGKTVAWDCDGVAKPKPKLKPLTDAESKEWKRRKAANRKRGEKLDALRAKYEAKKAELLKAIQPLKDEIDALARKWNDEEVAMIAYERREAAYKRKEIELRNEKAKRANQLIKQLMDADEKRMMMVWNVGNKKGGRK